MADLGGATCADRPALPVLSVNPRDLADAKALTGDDFTHGHREGGSVAYCAGRLTARKPTPAP